MSLALSLGFSLTLVGAPAQAQGPASARPKVAPTSAPHAASNVRPSSQSTARPTTRPNVLWITSEDMSLNLGSFGDAYARTPNLDRLASQGVRYLNAFAPIGVCAPSRSSLILGMYAPSAGTSHMRSKRTLPAGLKLGSQVVREAGYYATNNVKEDYNLVATPKEAWDESSDKAHWRNRKDPKQPFFAVFNLGASHESQIRQSEESWAKKTAGFLPGEVHDPALAPLPPYHPDVPEVRKDWARYADTVTVMDRQAGVLLQDLETDGLADDTIVFYYSDHGAGMPRSKRWLYDSSLRVPMIVRFPKKWAHLAPTAPGGIDGRMISFVDLYATVLALAGAARPANFQGQPFLTLEGPPKDSGPRYTYGFRDRMDERYDCLRTVRDRRYRYIRNYNPHRPFAQRIAYMYEMPTMQAWQRLWDEGKLVGPQRAFFEPKASEELYDTWADPHQVHNLVAAPELQADLQRLRAELDRWMLEIHDSGLLPEAEMLARAEGSTIYEMVRDPAKYDQRRIMDVAALASARDPKNRSKLTGVLTDKDSAVRYWAATGLLILGRAAAPSAAALAKALGDSSPNVRIAAAEALCTIEPPVRDAGGKCGPALAVLGTALGHAAHEVRLHAANVLDLLAPSPKALTRIATSIKEAAQKEPRASYAGQVLPHLVARLARTE